MDSTLLWTISICVGLTTGLVFWQLYRLFKGVPPEDRTFCDRLPCAFRLVWPLVHVLSYRCSEKISPESINRTQQLLNSAGLFYTMTAAQFIVARWICSAVFFALSTVAVYSHAGNVDFIALVPVIMTMTVLGYLYPQYWAQAVTRRRHQDILKVLPFYLDMLTLSIEAGTNLTGGLSQAVQKSSDSLLRREFSRVLRDIRAGRSRADALRDLGQRTATPAVQHVVNGLIQAERTGSSLGPLLRAQARQLRSERFQCAEKQAMQAPVKLLGPLVIFIFPTSFLVLLFLLLSKAIGQGIVTSPMLLWAYHWPGVS